VHCLFKIFFFQEYQELTSKLHDLEAKEQELIGSLSTYEEEFHLITQYTKLEVEENLIHIYGVCRQKLKINHLFYKYCRIWKIYKIKKKRN